MQLKQESLETLQKMNLYPMDSSYSSRNPAVNIRSSEVTRIMQKYDSSDPRQMHRRSQSISGPISQDTYDERSIRGVANSERPSFHKNSTDKIYPPTRESFGGRNDNLSGDFQTTREDGYDTRRDLHNENKPQTYYPPERPSTQHELHIDLNNVKEPLKETPQQPVQQGPSKPLSYGNHRILEEIQQNQPRTEETPLRSSRGMSYERQPYNAPQNTRRAFDVNFDQTPVRQTNYDLYRQDRDLSMALLTAPQIFDNFGPKIRDEKGSMAYKNAMKALQDRIKALEEENVSLKKKLADQQAQEEHNAEEMQKKFKEEISSLKEKEQELQEHFAKLQEHNHVLKQDLQDAKDSHLKFVEEQNGMMYQLQKTQEDLRIALESTDGLQKQIEALESEKTRHLEENLIDRNEYEKRIAELTEQLRVTSDQAQKIEAEFKVTLQAKNEAEAQLNKVKVLFTCHFYQIFFVLQLVSEIAQTEKRDCLLIAELESKYEKAQGQLSQLEGQSMFERERYEKELHSLRRKMSNLEEKARTAINGYEQKILVTSEMYFLVLKIDDVGCEKRKQRRAEINERFGKER